MCEIIAVRVHGWGIAVGWSHIVIAIAVIPPTDEARKPLEDGTELDGLQLRCISDFQFVPGSSVGCIYGSLMQCRFVQIGDTIYLISPINPGARLRTCRSLDLR